MAMTPDERRIYNRRHRRNEIVRGKAKLLKCVFCANKGISKQAHDWANVHGTDPDDVMNYIPLCRKCHIAYDPRTGHRVPHTAETKALLSQKNTGYKHTPEAVEKIRAAALNPSDEARAKMSAGARKGAAARNGQPMSDEQRAKISAALKAHPSRPAGNPDLGKTRAAQQRAKTHCPHGHELTPDNIYWRGPPDNRTRQCKTCTRERAAARYEAQREAAALLPKPPSRRGGARPGTGDPEFGRRRGAQQRAKTHCPAGHEYTEENTYIIQRKGGGTARQCKICTKAKAAVQAAAKRSQKAAGSDPAAA